METTEIQKEHERLALLKELRLLLASAIESLKGKQESDEMESRYLFWTAVQMNRIADGYLVLRESSRIDASKLLVRPGLELTFAARAVKKERGFLYLKAHEEARQQKNMFTDSEAGQKWFDQQVEELKRAIKAKDPDYPIPVKVGRILIADVIRKAGVEEESMEEGNKARSSKFYRDYQAYCSFTHGGLIAIQGKLDKVTFSRDTNLVFWCVLMQLALLKDNTPADVPDFTPLVERMMSL
jgi:hypothetical protein